MKRRFPLDKNVTLNSHPSIFLPSYASQTEIALAPHPGSFGFVRKNHTHEGVDLYCEEGDFIYCAEEGIFQGYCLFTGEEVGSPWWNTTYSAIIKHKDFVGVYGELIPIAPNVPTGYPVNPGYILGMAVPVLKKNKGRPMTMLHFEMYNEDITECADWKPNTPQPSNLLDPTQYLIDLARECGVFISGQ